MIRTDPPVVPWQTITEFPKYEMSLSGEVRNVDSGIRVPPATFDGVDYVELMRDGKPYLHRVDRLRWVTFPLPGFPPSRTPFERHGAWIKADEHYEDGEKSHLCGLVCSVGEV